MQQLNGAPGLSFIAKLLPNCFNGLSKDQPNAGVDSVNQQPTLDDSLLQRPPNTPAAAAMQTLSCSNRQQGLGRNWKP